MEAFNTAVYTRVAHNAAVYTRLSVEDNNIEFGNSIETQKEMLINYVSEQEGMEIYDLYCDNGVSGTTFEREGLSKDSRTAQSRIRL